MTETKITMYLKGEIPTLPVYPLEEGDVQVASDEALIGDMKVKFTPNAILVTPFDLECDKSCTFTTYEFSFF